MPGDGKMEVIRAAAAGVWQFLEGVDEANYVIGLPYRWLKESDGDVVITFGEKSYCKEQIHYRVVISSGSVALEEGWYEPDSEILQIDPYGWTDLADPRCFDVIKEFIDEYHPVESCRKGRSR